MAKDGSTRELILHRIRNMIRALDRVLLSLKELDDFNQDRHPVVTDGIPVFTAAIEELIQALIKWREQV